MPNKMVISQKQKKFVVVSCLDWMRQKCKLQKEKNYNLQFLWQIYKWLFKRNSIVIFNWESHSIKSPLYSFHCDSDLMWETWIFNKQKKRNSNKQKYNILLLTWIHPSTFYYLKWLILIKSYHNAWQFFYVVKFI